MGRWIKNRLVVTAQLKKSKRTNKKKKKDKKGERGNGWVGWLFKLGILSSVYILPFILLFSHPTDHPRHDTPIYLSAFLFTLLARPLLFLFYIYSLAALLSFFSSASAYGEEHRVGFSLTSFPAAFWYLIFLSHFVEYCLVLSLSLGK